MATKSLPAELDAATATAVLEAQAKQRLETCTAEIAACLDKHQCVLFGYAVIASGSVDVRIEIRPRG